MTAVNDSHVVYASDTMGNQNRRPPPIAGRNRFTGLRCGTYKTWFRGKCKSQRSGISSATVSQLSLSAVLRQARGYLEQSRLQEVDARS
jgi:hypothetical protein